jgi:hypothetical protein
MSKPTNSETPAVKAVRIKLLLLAALFVVPALTAWLVFRYAPPRGGVNNYGELVEVRTIRGLSGTSLLAPGGTWAMESLAGRWVMVFVSGGACADDCERQLYYMRQVARAQGREEARVARLWLVTDQVSPAQALRAAHPGLVMARVTSGATAAWFPTAEGYRQAIWLVDPLGNVMMRFPDRPDAGRVIKDLRHLLKTSQIG